MSYISPNTRVVLLSGVPLDKNYTNTLYFERTGNLLDDWQTQYGVMYNYKAFEFTQHSYQRHTYNTIRVAQEADVLFKCNYMMFQNNSYSSKWFYAFIDKVEYVSNNCTEITYTLDVMQTWYFDYEVGTCFVEREHDLTDNIGDNLVPEDFNAVPSVIAASTNIRWKESTIVSGHNYDLLIYYTSTNKVVYIDYVNGRYGVAKPTVAIQTRNIPTTSFRYQNFCGVAFVQVPININLVYQKSTTELSNLNQLIIDLVNTIIGNDVEGTISAMYIVPSFTTTSYLQIAPTDHSRVYPSSDNGISYASISQNKRFFPPSTRISEAGYVAKNQKLYTSPYNILEITNNEGSINTYLWENTIVYTMEDNLVTKSNHKFQFLIKSVEVPAPVAALIPYYYRGTAALGDYTSAISISQFPQATWSEDSFVRWWSQNIDAVNANILVSAIKDTVAFASGGVGLSTINTIVNNGISGLNAKNLPEQMSGQVTLDTIRISENKICFTAYQKTISKDEAISIDNYFSMYGYAQKKLKQPNIFSAKKSQLRPNWNYIKTANLALINKDIKISGSGAITLSTGYSIPQDDEQLICDIYNKGITFWMNPNYVGHYELDNSPVSTSTMSLSSDDTAEDNINLNSSESEVNSNGEAENSILGVNSDEQLNISDVLQPSDGAGSSEIQVD